MWNALNWSHKETATGFHVIKGICLRSIWKMYPNQESWPHQLTRCADQNNSSLSLGPPMIPILSNGDAVFCFHPICDSLKARKATMLCSLWILADNSAEHISVRIHNRWCTCAFSFHCRDNWRRCWIRIRVLKFSFRTILALHGAIQKWSIGREFNLKETGMTGFEESGAFVFEKKVRVFVNGAL